MLVCFSLGTRWEKNDPSPLYKKAKKKTTSEHFFDIG